MKTTTSALTGSRFVLPFASLLAVSLMLPACTDTNPDVEAPGNEESAKIDALEMGAGLLQTNAPLEPMDVYLVGFHPMKGDPSHQMEAHHFCNQVNQDFAQCVLFDGNARDANLTGIEYIISERLFETLPGEEKGFWHPHNYEILSGQLVAPGLPGVAEMELMETKMNSYGKTWHVWSSRTASGESDVLPFGEAMLAWSFNRDAQADSNMVAERDRRMGIDSRAKRQERSALARLARPQMGEDGL